MKYKYIILALITASINLPAKSLEIPLTDKKIKIDGYFYTAQETNRHLCDAAWKKAAILTGPKDTNIYVMRDKNYLYLGFLCRNEDQECRRAEKKMHDEHEIWTDSSIELFIKPEKSKDSFQLIFNSAGVSWDSKNRNKKFDIGADVFAIGDRWTWKDWYLEIKLPISEIDPDRKYPLWGVNVLRNTYTSGKRTYSWMCPQGQEFKFNMGSNYAHNRKYCFKHLRQIATNPGKQFVRLRILNPKKTNETIVVTMKFDINGNKKIVKRSIKTKGTVRGLKMSYDVPNTLGQAQLRLAINSPDGYECFAESHYFQVKKSEKKLAAFSSSKYFAGTNKAKLYINIPDDLKFESDKYICQISVMSLTGTKIKEKQIVLKSQNTKTTLEIDKLLSGSYKVNIILIDKISNKKIKKVKTGFTKEAYKLFK